MTITQTKTHGIFNGPATLDRKQRWFREGSVPVAIYGLGKMGLPLAAVFADCTGNAIGVDIDETVVDQINRGDCHIENEPRLPSLIAETVKQDALQATSDPIAAAQAASVHVIIVPTTLDEQNAPDLDTFEAAVRSIGTGLEPEDMVIVESTVPPGTSRTIVAPILEAESGLDVGEFGLAFCPERTASGRAIYDIRSAYPKIVGGIDEASTATARLIYDQVTENRVISVSDITTAECVKVFEGVYRDVNIALANELARFTDELDVDILEAIQAANTQPYCDLHDPGAGVGGHCIPYYPYFLISELNSRTPLLEAARTVNESMPEYTATKLVDGLVDEGIDPTQSTVAILGVAYRPGVQETRASPAFPIIERLSEAGVSTVVVDPIIENLEAIGLESARIDELAHLDLDGLVLVTAHDAFDDIDWSSFDDLVIVDGRDALDLDGTDHSVYTIGRG